METKWSHEATGQLCSWWLTVWVEFWYLPDTSHALPYPPRKMDMVGWFYPCKGASPDLEQWCLGRGETHRKSSLGELWALKSRMVSRGGRPAPLWSLPFPLITGVYKLCLQEYIMTCLYPKSIAELCKRKWEKMLNVWRSHLQFPPWERVKINYDIWYLRLGNLTHLLIQVLETRFLGFYKNAKNQETLVIYSIIAIVCLKDPFI